MELNKIKLKNFRNHKTLELEFDNKLTLIQGANGSGKTNILESIYLLSASKSNKARYDRDMIEHDKNFCSVVGNVLSDDQEYLLEVQIIKSEVYENASTKKGKVNKVAKSQKLFNKVFNTVIFAPEDIEIITGSPSERRKHMDLVLSQIDYEYKRALTTFTKSLRQRNKLLEMINEEGRGRGQLGFWEEKIIESGEFIQQKRTELLNFYQDDLANNGSSIKKDLEIVYKINKISPERIESHRDKEIMAKTTLVGPHRDDFEILMDGYDISEFGSRGQQRSAILSLKIAEINFIEKKVGEKPVLLLDDIFSELDDEHRKEVIRLIDFQQTIITSAEKLNLGKSCKLVNL